MENYTNKEILAILLQCKSEDLVLLRNIRYDLRIIIAEIRQNHKYGKEGITLKNIMAQCQHDAIDDMETRLYSLKRKKLSQEEETIKQLYPVEDLHINLEGLDTNVTLVNKKLYQKYMPELIREISENLGIEIKDGGDQF